MATATEQVSAAASFGVVTGVKQPRRLSPQTRQLAVRYISGEIGRGMRPAAFSLDPALLASNPSPTRQYAEAVYRVAEQAPLRILPGELLAGAATLPEAMGHRMPLTPFSSTSHTTLGFEKALRIGYRGIRREITKRLERGGLDAGGTELLNAMLRCLDAAGTWHKRYAGALEKLVAGSSGSEGKHYATLLETMRSVPENPPRSFREALQSLWLLWDFQRLCGTWSGIGRIDRMLGPFLKADLAARRITLPEARELIAHFLIKGCEWITAEGRGSGDAQFYQNIVLAGVDEEGRDVTNDVTYLVLDVVEELHISDFPIAVRLSRRSPDKLVRRIAEVQRLGGGIVAVYNEDLILESLQQFGYPLKEARNFANDGCWEVIIPGHTCFAYQAFDMLALLQRVLDGGKAETYRSFEALYAAFLDRLASQVDELTDKTRTGPPSPLVSLLTEDCIERGRAYYNGGPRYTVLSPHAGGLPDAANSLLVIRTLVFEDHELSLPELVNLLKTDWAAGEPLRRRIINRFDFYGNDAPQADAMLRRVYNDFTALVGHVRERHGILRPAGLSTFGREGTDFLPHRWAAASGQHRGETLATNFSPSPGTDRRGPTAVIKSHCSVDYRRLPCGTALELKLHPGSVQGEAGLKALMGLSRTFVELGGLFMQIDVVDTELLRDAQEHPDKYPNLSVRVSGWSARFATLSREWQDLIIRRTQQCGP